MDGKYYLEKMILLWVPLDIPMKPYSCLLPLLLLFVLDAKSYFEKTQNHKNLEKRGYKLLKARQVRHRAPVRIVSPDFKVRSKLHESQ